MKICSLISEFENHLEQQQNLNETEAIDNTNIISQAEEMFENELVKNKMIT